MWGALFRCCRDWTRLASMYFPKPLRSKAARYAQVLAWTLKAHVRCGLKSKKDGTAKLKDDPSYAIKTLLNCHEADDVLHSANRPFYTICKLTEILGDGIAFVPEFARYRMDRTLSECVNIVGGCERLLATPIPVSYTRHTSRSLMLWLITLPFALYPLVGWMTVPSVALLSFIFLGIDEIGVQVEEPFAILPLLPICLKISENIGIAMTEIKPRASQPVGAMLNVEMAYQ